MASSSKSVPPCPTCESGSESDNISTPKKHKTAPTETKRDNPLHPTITAIRIPVDHTLPYLIRLELVKATPDYHFNLYDSTLFHHSKSNAHCIRHTKCRCINFHDLLANVAGVDENQLYDPDASAYEKILWSLEESERVYRRNAFSYGNGYGTLLNLPLAKKLGKPHLTFTHASLHLQPNVVDPYWRSGEAWNKRAFQRLHAVPREGVLLEGVPLDMITGEYHIMYTRDVGKGLLPNMWSWNRIHGDAFVLKMASGTNEEGDLYYEDIPPEILRCSLGNQVLETLRNLRPDSYSSMVGERGNGPPGVISSGTGLKGMFALVYVAHE